MREGLRQNLTMESRCNNVKTSFNSGSRRNNGMTNNFVLSLSMALLLLLSFPQLGNAQTGDNVNGTNTDDNSNTNENSCHSVDSSVFGCDNTDCQNFVCANDPSCCSVAWTSNCVALALKNGVACPIGTDDYVGFNCFQSPQPPNCIEPATCSALLCVARPECCQIYHDEACAAAALQLCPLPPGDGTNTCFQPTPVGSAIAGCHDVDTCLPVVCAEDPTCCSQEYTQDCVQIARQNGYFCSPLQPTNSCTNQTSNVGGCVQQDCQEKVCDISPTCCNYIDSNGELIIGEYTQDCVDVANAACPGSNDPPTNDCFTTSSRPGCNDDECITIVCGTNPECCTDSYKPACIEIARQNGFICSPPTPPTNDCATETSDFGGCRDDQCQEIVCAIRPGCCNSETGSLGEWSQACVDIASTECFKTITQNTCFETSRQPGCSDPTCEAYVCRGDDFCCRTQWDSSCVRKAMTDLEKCSNDFPTQVNTCFQADPFKRPNCNDDIDVNNPTQSADPMCNSKVCEEKPECCLESYTRQCADTALKVCTLPEPINHCFETSLEIPGCNQDECEDAVCEEEPSCCTRAWTDACIKEARKHPDVCFPPSPKTNDCLDDVSTTGGCSEKRCSIIVCDVEDSCCDNSERIGEWDDLCVDVANDLCQPEILPRPDRDDDCPKGFTCSADSMANCTGIRLQAKDTLDLGDIYGGIYCGNPSDGIENCEVGYYCPDPETKIICPAGYFCPHKTIKPEIICGWCKEGSTRLMRDLYGFIMLAVVIGLTIIYFIFKTFRFNRKIIDQYHNFQKSFLSNHFSEFEHRMIELKNKRSSSKRHAIYDLEKLRPKLELINRRIKELQDEQEAEAELEPDKPMSEKHTESESDCNNPVCKVAVTIRHLAESLRPGEAKVSNSTLATGGADGKKSIEFDARHVFDVLDADDSGDVSFEELNRILGFNDLELGEFVRRMNELAGSSRELNSVTRPVFVKYFLQVLQETSSLTVSFEEAEELFMTMSEGKDELHMSRFYTSSMSEFLSDIQILDLIKRFKAIKKNLMVEASGRRPSSRRNSSRRGSSSNGTGRKSMIGRQSVLRRPSSAMKRASAIGSGTGSVASGTLYGMNNNTLMTVSKGDFTEYYPQLLLEVTVDEADLFDDEEGQEVCMGVDISFKDLSLAVKVGKKSFNVVDNVTGRIRGKTMTALMGGSGAGKTSLLNALCGRAFYGETKGLLHVNGHKTTIKEHKDAVGFVPQDDIVYAELTVRENLIYAGRFRLPKGTPTEIIEDLADETLANLGLSRVADSPVGDIRRRGVSGGEKKRVNIGLELMAEPSILFLDEPTSGLDASSALLVMKSLKHLVEKQGVTVVSVIHQPRKFIYDLFDSLILLGVGGRMVYHGPTANVTNYFNHLNYSLPPGESVADWLIDISSGRLEPDNQIACQRSLETSEKLPRQASRHRDLGKSFDLKQVLENEPSEVFDKPKSRDELEQEVQVPEQAEGEKRSPGGGMEQPRESQRIHVTDNDVVGGKGVTAGKVVKAFEEAKNRRDWLYEQWNIYFENLKGDDKAMYEVPEKYELPQDVVKPSFGYQLFHQIRRQFVVAWRNRFFKFLDTVIIVGASVVITALGVPNVTEEHEPDISFDVLVRPTQDDFEDIFGQLFRYVALTRQITYSLKVGIILCVLLGLTGTKIVTSKRIEFFREAGSGYDINAYFVAINFASTIEHSVQVMIAAFFCSWMRIPLAGIGSFFVHFLLLSHVTTAWSILLPMIFDPDQVTLIAGFFFSFFGLMCSGAFPPITYEDIYESGGFLELFAGWFAPTRFFYEALAVGEYRCLPEQSIFTITDEAVNRPYNTSGLVFLGYVGHDPTATRRSCNGWYWGVLPSFMVGLTVRYGAMLAMHGFNRAQQTKKSLWYVMGRDTFVALRVVLYILFLFAMIVFSSWTIVRDVPFEQPVKTREELIGEYIEDFF